MDTKSNRVVSNPNIFRMFLPTDRKHPNHRRSHVSLWLFLVAPFFIATSCIQSKLQKNLAANAETQAAELANLSQQIARESQTPIKWNDAVKRMHEDNLSLQTSEQQLEDTEKQTRNQWLTLVPNLSSFLSIGDSLSEISDLDSSNLNVNVAANLNIPNPFNFHATLYALALQRQNAIWSHELDRRRAYVQLYSIFLEEDRITEQENSLASRKRRVSLGPSDGLVQTIRRLEIEEMNLQRRRAQHRVAINQMLNTPGSNWKPAGGLPKISYRNRYNQISIGEHFGKLALNLQTIQIEGAILRLKQVKFQQWPSVSFGLSTPPLYTSNSTTTFSSDDLQFFSGASKSFSATNFGGRDSIQNAELRLKYTREQLRSRMESEIVRIQEGKVGYKKLLAEEKYLLARIKRFTQSGPSDAIIVAKDLETLSEMELQLAEARRRLQQLDLQFLIWDENHWKN